MRDFRSKNFAGNETTIAAISSDDLQNLADATRGCAGRGCRRADRAAARRRGPADSQQEQPGSKNLKRARPKYVPVVAIVNGCSARVTLMPAGGGRYRIQLNTALRKAARADVGDVVRVELRLDRASRETPVPADLRLALKENPAARRVFDAF